VSAAARGPVKTAGRLFALLHWLEDAILVSVLGTMILLGAAQILMRNLLGEGLAWGDPLLRVLVLWAALVGAMVAARSDAHIRIDVLHQFLPARLKPWVDAVLRLATAAISFTLAWVSARFVLDEREYGVTAFGGVPGIGDVPAWVCELIIPIAFTVLGLRYLLLALRPSLAPAGPDAPVGPDAQAGPGAHEGSAA
jgi:TRAP-type C4-dicarboxylate transport system permease small subunit